MKKGIISIASLIFAGLMLLALIPPNYPPLPEIEKELSNPVTYAFKMNKIGLNQTEISHLDSKKPLFLNLKLQGSWETKRPTLILSSISKNSRFSNGKKVKDYRTKMEGKDFSKFLKDNRGKQVQSYAFKNTLVLGKDKKQYLKIAYEGPSMPMVNTLILKERMAFPEFCQQDLKSQKHFSLQAGTYRLEKETNSFYIWVN
jgi:hypothetical protein